MNDLSDCLAWPIRDPQWWRKSILIGLLSLVPVLGLVNLAGWMLACLDRLRKGQEDLAPPGLYLGRGVRLFGVMTIYSVVVAAAAGLLLLAAVELSMRAAEAPLLAGAALLLYALFYSVVILANLLLSALTPPIVLATERGGLRTGLNPRLIVRMLRQDPGGTILCGLMALLAGFLATLGIVLCVVGVVLSLGYGYAVMAAVCRSYELNLTPARRNDG